MAKGMVRILGGLLAAALWLPVIEYLSGGGYGAFWAVSTGLFTVPLTLLVATPFVFFSRHNLSLARCAISGLTVGAVGAVLFAACTNIQAGLNWAPLLIGCGVVSGLVFWLAGVWRNPAITFASSRRANARGLS